ncbi:nucleotidyl transferase AbiEii/AbiGii toxin family protein [Rhodococcus sp. NPDC060090]|uniref:nucleotidyl transferase AbiEii/AbiGii toxin family protein n=1 Tax=Rhodococcus sp. NPDC060090 TaxID=3347056 RepID=UPI003666B3B2
MSTVNGSSQYATSNAFRRALEDRLKREAKTRGRVLAELRREFLFQRFLALIFSATDSKWVLKGGASLLMRLTQARFSKDLDLLRLGEITPDAAIAELRDLTAPRENDHLTFVIEEGIAYRHTNPIIEISVTAYIGAKYSSFPLDLPRELHLVAEPERIRPTPVVDMPGLAKLPEVVVYPLANQVADKVCAMYERYGELESPSSRYRDRSDISRHGVRTRICRQLPQPTPGRLAQAGAVAGRQRLVGLTRFNPASSAVPYRAALNLIEQPFELTETPAHGNIPPLTLK